MSWHAWRFVGLMIVLIGLAATYAWRSHADSSLAEVRDALERRDLSAASAILTRAAQESPDNSEVHFLFARVARRRGDLDGMKSHLEQAASLGFPVDRLDREQTLALAQTGRLRDAEHRLPDMLVNAGEDGREICEAFVNGYLVTYRFQDAEGLLDAWQAEYPDDPQPHYVRGLIHLNLRRESEAISSFREALDRDEQQNEARLKLALLLTTRHQYAEASELFGTLLERDPDNSEAKCGLAECLMGVGQFEKSREILTELVESVPEFAKGRETLGRLELDAGHAERAVEILKPLVQDDPRNSEARFVYGSALQAAGKTEAAKPHLEYVAEARPALQRARRLMEDVLSTSDDVDLRFAIGSILMKYASPTDAIDWLKSVIDIRPDHVAAHRMLAEHYESVGKAQLATHHYDQVDRHSPTEVHK